jgi:uncharacterized protein (TIGR02001 family)
MVQNKAKSCEQARVAPQWCERAPLCHISAHPSQETKVNGTQKLGMKSANNRRSSSTLQGTHMKKSTVSKSILALACLASLGLSAQAQTAPAEPESTLAFNAGVVSEYRYRGLSQSRFQPALQGGADYTDKSGVYVGAWASTIKWIKDTAKTDGNCSTACKGDIELDLYGGYKFSIGDLGMDVGYLRYQYVNNNLNPNANTDEAYAAGTYGPFTLKYSYAFSNLFGTANSKGSTYTDLSANFDLGSGFTLTPHVGYQYVKKSVGSTYTDYGLTLAKDLGDGLSVTATAIGVDGNQKTLVLGALAGSDVGKFSGKSTVVLGLKYTF